MKIKQHFFVFILLIIACPFIAGADTIVFKSGKKIIVDKVWEEGSTFKCNRFGKEVIYPKITIERIEKSAIFSDSKRVSALLKKSFAPGKPVKKWSCSVLEPFNLPAPYRVRTNYTKPGVDRTSKTRAFTLAENGNFEELKELIAQKPETLYQTNTSGTNLLMYACGCGHLEVAKYLLDQGFDVNAGDDAGRTALMFASKGKLSQRRKKCITYLIDHGANMELVNDTADVGYHKNEGTAFMLALDAGQQATADHLIALGADINAKNSQGNTALHLAYKKGDKYLKFLLDRGALADIYNIFGMTPYDLFADAGRKGWLNKELKRMDMEIPQSPLTWGEIRIAIRDTGYNRKGKSCFHKMETFWKSARHKDYTRKKDDLVFKVKQDGNVDWVKYLFDQKPELARQMDKYGRTFLHWSAEYYHTKALELFIDSGIPVDVQDKNGQTALHLGFDKKPMVDLLIANGANPRLTDNNGQTPLHLIAKEKAINRDLRAIAKIYIDAGANVNQKDDNGKIPLDLAGNLKMKNVLLSGK